MFFHGLPASAMYYRDQRVSSLYWRGMKIWQADASSPPLREGQLKIVGFNANFGQLNPTLSEGLLHLVRKTASFSYKGGLAKGSLTLSGRALATRQTATLAKGSLNIHGSTFVTKEKVTLASRMLNLTGKTATFTLLAPTAWTPASLTGLLAWHDVTDLATITAAGGTISAWNDKSGNSNHLTEATNKPNYSGSVQLNGFNIVDCGHFNSGGKRMGWASPITTAKAVFLVIGTGANANSEGGGFLLGGSSTFPFHRGAGLGASYSDTLLNSTFADAVLTSTSAIFRRNGLYINPVTTGFEGENSWQSLFVASSGAAIGSMYAINEDRGSRYGGADYAAVVMLSAIPSDDDIRRLEGYYKNKFATLKLPEIHPYISSPPVIGDTPTNGTVSAHRYGRFTCTANVNDTSFSGMTEFQAYETIGGTNVITGATLSTPQTIQAGSLANLKDGDLSTTQAQWQDLGLGPIFDIIVDFGSGVTKAINQIGIAPDKDAVNRSPRLMYWSVSDDGTTWTTSWVAKYTGSYTVGTLVKISAASI